MRYGKTKNFISKNFDRFQKVTQHIFRDKSMKRDTSHIIGLTI